MKEYKLIRNYNGAEKGGMFTYDEEFNVYEYEHEKVTTNGISNVHLAYSPEVMDMLEEGGFVSSVIEEEPTTKLDSVMQFIDELINTYTKDHDELMKEYEEGNVQPCVKVEAETVYCNLIKVLTAIKDKINE